MSLRSVPVVPALTTLLLASAACATPTPDTDAGNLVIRVDHTDARLSTLTIYLNQPPIRKVWLGTVRPGEEKTFTYDRRLSRTHFQLLAEGSRGMRRMRTIDFKSDGLSSAHFTAAGSTLVEWDLRRDRILVTYHDSQPGS